MSGRVIKMGRREKMSETYDSGRESDEGGGATCQAYLLVAGPRVVNLAVSFGLPVAGSLRGFREVGLGARFGAGLGPGR